MREWRIECGSAQRLKASGQPVTVQRGGVWGVLDPLWYGSTQVNTGQQLVNSWSTRNSAMIMFQILPTPIDKDNINRQEFSVLSLCYCVLPHMHDSIARVKTNLEFHLDNWIPFTDLHDLPPKLNCEILDVPVLQCPGMLSTSFQQSLGTFQHNSLGFG